MAVKIRLARRGRKKMAIYDVVVADARAPRDGRFIEKIGTYNPNTPVAAIVLDNERAFQWLMNGAQPTDTVKAMLSYRGVLLRRHLQIGVVKGALTQEDADKKLEAWMNDKSGKIEGKEQQLADQKASEKKARLDAETKVNEARAEAIKKRQDEAEAAIKAAEAPVVEEAPVAVVEETPAVEEAPAPVVEETPAVEEAPATVVEETPTAKATEEAPAPKADDAPAAEDKKED
ncbi:MAG: small subunit ribosomal protein S16 [Marivirga sp.]|jgi:small subunit ribosomal protein S16